MIRVITLFVLVISLPLFLTNCENGSQSEQLYLTHCGSCHTPTGEGLGELIPSLVYTDAFANNREKTICQIRYGAGMSMEESGTTYVMPANEKLSEIEITNILNYIRKQWHSDVEEFSIAEIKKSLENCNK